jgi:hypothetical protein
MMSIQLKILIVKKSKRLLPVLPSTPYKNSSMDKEKGREIAFEIKTRVGQLSDATNYKKFVRNFGEGSSQEWIDMLKDLEAEFHDWGHRQKIQNIVESKYCPVDQNKIIAGCNLLSTSQQEKLHKVLNKFAHLFDGTLGNWKADPVNLELKDTNEKPYHAKPYPVPHSQEQQLKDEVQWLVDFGFQQNVKRSEWACPMFTIAKPDKLLRSLADLRELNKRIKD